MMKTKLTIATTALFALTLAACGSKTPSIDQVKADFENPTGSTKSKQTVAGAYAKQSSSGTAASFAAGGFAGGGFGLTQGGKGAGLFTRQNVIEPLRRHIQARALGLSQQHLSESQDASCFDSASVLGDAQPGDTSGSFSYSVDLSQCSDGQATGKLTVDGEWEVDQTAGIFRFDMEQTLDAVCTNEPSVCVTGSMVLEMEFNATDLSGGGTGSFFSGWFFTITEDGKTYETKGGMRLSADSSGAGSFEYLIYVKDESGNEVSLVLSYKNDGQGNEMLDIRGTDGSISCSFQADGSGSCEGDLEWDSAFVDALEADEDFSRY